MKPVRAGQIIGRWWSEAKPLQQAPFQQLAPLGATEKLDSHSAVPTGLILYMLN